MLRRVKLRTDIKSSKGTVAHLFILFKKMERSEKLSVHVRVLVMSYYNIC